MRVYYDRDADVNMIKAKKVAIVGYGTQGHAHAKTCATAASRTSSSRCARARPRRKKAEAAGIKVMTPAEAAKWADVVMVLAPDELQAELYNKDLEPNMREGSAIAFAHGLNIHFRLIEPRPDMDVFMIAPKGPGHTVRSEYLRAAACRASSRSTRTSRATRSISRSAMPRRIGGGRSGVIETSFREECETDLFGEQVGALRRAHLADPGRLRDAGRGRLCARNGLFRMPARGEADRRPDL